MERTESTTIAWILLAISFWNKDSVTREEIIHSADAINHAVPLESELEVAIRFLVLQGLILEQDRSFSISDSAREMIESAHSASGNIIDVWKALEPHISSLGAA